jgi:simple sugar transport system permease protein
MPDRTVSPWYGSWQRVMGRPEAAAIAGTALVFAIFAVTAGGSGMCSRSTA